MDVPNAAHMVMHGNPTTMNTTAIKTALSEKLECKWMVVAAVSTIIHAFGLIH